MRICTLAYALLMALVAPVTVAGRWPIHRDEARGFQIEYPYSWAVRSSGDETTAFKAGTTRPSGETMMVMVKCGTVGRMENPAAVLLQMEHKLLQPEEGREVLASGRGNIGVVPAIWVRYKGTLPAVGEIEGRALCAVLNSKAYSVSFVCTGNRWRDYEHLFDTMQSSFTFLDAKGNVLAESPLPTPTATDNELWGQYRDAMHKCAIHYPSNWPVELDWDEGVLLSTDGDLPGEGRVSVLLLVQEMSSAESTADTTPEEFAVSFGEGMGVTSSTIIDKGRKIVSGSPAIWAVGTGEAGILGELYWHVMGVTRGSRLYIVCASSNTPNQEVKQLMRTIVNSFVFDERDTIVSSEEQYGNIGSMIEDQAPKISGKALDRIIETTQRRLRMAVARVAISVVALLLLFYGGIWAKKPQTRRKTKTQVHDRNRAPLISGMEDAREEEMGQLAAGARGVEETINCGKHRTAGEPQIRVQSHITAKLKWRLIGVSLGIVSVVGVSMLSVLLGFEKATPIHGVAMFFMVAGTWAWAMNRGKAEAKARTEVWKMDSRSRDAGGKSEVAGKK